MALHIAVLRRLAASVSLLSLCSLSAPAFSLDTQLIDSGFASPLFLTAPDGDSRLFVVEREGRIKVRSGGVWSTFLDISGQVDPTGERGLLGLAFDPNYRSNQTFYVDYIDKATKNTQIARFTASGRNSNIANPVGATILTIPQPDRPNHKAGWIGFRPGENNNLYIATGDGGGENDPDNNAQNKNSLLGKMLRLDVHSSGGGGPEVWDYGLRNPFRNSFDRTKGNLIIADVGQDKREELNFEPNGQGGNNYGWRVREGKIQNPAYPNEAVPANAKDPVYDYAHGGGTFDGETVIGGYVYRGSFLKAVQGEYFFADFISGKVWSMDTDPSSGALLPNTVRDRTAELKRLNDFNSITSFGEDGFGNLYMVDLSGKVLAIVPEPSTYAILLIGIMPLAWRVARGLRR